MKNRKKTFTPIPPMAELPAAEKVNVAGLLDAYESGEYDMICVLGPTASGKTRYAVRLARELNALLSRSHDAGDAQAEEQSAESGRHLIETGEHNAEPERSHRQAEIISADSRQVYRGMTIGTGKDLSEYEEIPYHLIDIRDAGEKYNIYEYQQDFSKAYKEIAECGNIPILCGGSGLYIDAVTKGYSLPPVPQDIRLREELEKETTEELIKRLASLKPLHNSTDYDTRKRLIRALEIAIYESEHPIGHSMTMPKRTYFIGTLVSRDERNARIDRRLDARLEEGMVKEVKSLLDSGIQAEDLIYYGLEYKFVTLYLTGQLTWEQMRGQLAIAIHQFAKRQMTWFRGMERHGVRIHWTEV
ncbi:MAG: tRNA (adenosine(37)-N6)-dimethylallyltransferase MiaA [Bacteroides sp.]|nr:tRNA (adenosine(37)-N6)-dimethylallyltransferase MiaA [Bacteroides sp.]